jgi:hypothetical protein
LVADLIVYEKPHQYAAGVEYVVLDRGSHTGACPGAILYGAGKLHKAAAP